MTPNVGDKIYSLVINSWSWWWQTDNHQDHLARTILTVLVPLLVFLWYQLTELYIKKGRTALPPGPYGLPVVGYLPFLTSNLHEKFTNMSHIYGPIFSMWLGSKLHVVVNSVDLVKVVARDLDQTFANRNPPITALTITYNRLDIAWSDNNAHWRNMRKLLVSQVLSNANLDSCAGFRTDEVRKVVRDVYGRIGERININKVAFDAELNVVTGMLWGCSETKDSSVIGDGFREVEFKIIELLGAPNVSDFIPMLSWFDLQGRQREMRKQKEHLDRIFDNIIGERSNGNFRKIGEDERKDFVQILLELKEQKDDGSISISLDQIKGLLFDILTAATDTTSTMVEWVMTEILHHPDVKTKIQEELNDVLGMNNIVEESHLSSLKYLDAVIKETFRIHPPLPLLIQRSPDEPCTVSGYMIPKGTIVYINVWAIHRDPKNWLDPLNFKPERFLKGKWDYNGNNMKFLPFGVGRRICPGIPLGEKMLVYILASLLHSFEWRLPKGEDFEVSDEFGFVTKKRKPLIAIPSQRLSDANLYL